MPSILKTNHSVKLDYIHIETVIIEEIVDEYLSSTDCSSHRHNFQEIFWIRSGYGTHLIDGKLYKLAPLTLALIGKGQVHKLEEAFGTNGYYIRFSDDFLPAVVGQSHNALFDPMTIINSIAVPPSEAHDLDCLFGLILNEHKRDGEFGVMRYLLLALLLKIEQFRRLNLSPLAGNYSLYDSFNNLLEENYRAEHEVSFYATSLHLSANNLSRLLQQGIGKSAKRIILERILLEAKRYLQFSELSIKEIANILGYADPYHFSKLFKQAEKLSPQSYRELNAK